MSHTSDNFGEVLMSTLATLDNPIRDEYDRDVMENLDNVADEYLDAEVVQDRIGWDHPSFIDISAWEIYRPSDENRYSILNRVEFRVRKSDSKKLVLECQKGEEICPWRLRVVVMARTSYWTVRKYRGDHRDYGYEISYWKAWKAQQKALVYLFGKWDESFNRLPHLMQALWDSSPNNFVKRDVTPLDDGTM
ncbi:hypothetical protein QQ045_010331 [Rhodiola kirilowii]